MLYILIVSAASALLVAAIHFGLLATSKGRTPQFRRCVMAAPAFLLTAMGVALLFWPIRLSPEQWQAVANYELADPGPLSFVEAVYFGFAPALVYSVVAMITVFMLRKLHKP